MANEHNRLCDTCGRENVCPNREEVLGSYRELTERLVSLTDLVDVTYSCKEYSHIRPNSKLNIMHPWD